MTKQSRNKSPSDAARAFAASVLDERLEVREGITAGRCMWPFLPAGVRAVPSGKAPRIGSVVFYRSGGAFRAHRVVGTFPGGVFTRPDRPGAPVERVSSCQISGVWERGAGWRTVFLDPRVGTVVARLGIALSSPASLNALRSISLRFPTIPPPLLDVGVFMGDAIELAETLSAAGLAWRLPTVEALDAEYLRPTGGFVVVARSFGRPFGAAAVNALPAEDAPSHRPAPEGKRSRRPRRQAALDAASSSSNQPDTRPLSGSLRLVVKRLHCRPEVFDALLGVTLDEARHRGFVRLDAEARGHADGERGPDARGRNASLDAAALRRMGFTRVDPVFRRVPATGGRIELYRWAAASSDEPEASSEKP